jgi:hypothetical protein
MSDEFKKDKTAGAKPVRMVPLHEGVKPTQMTPVQPAKPASPPSPTPEPPKKK